MSEGRPSILVVEDEPSQLEMLAYNLGVEGYDVLRADTGEEAKLLLQENEVDLVLLDWMLPQMSGLQLCRHIKDGKDTQKIPVMMLTARGEEEDKIRGLDKGADDYIVKPYSIKELMARVRAHLRAKKSSLSLSNLKFEELEMDLDRHLVTFQGQRRKLGPIEFKLLRVFLEAPKRVFSREQLLERVWERHTDVETRTVDVHIGRLRKQLKNGNKNFEYIRTIRGFGYSLDAEFL